MCDGMFSGFFNGSHEGCIRVDICVVYLGIFLSSEEAERSKVFLREFMAARRDDSVPSSSPLGSLAMMEFVGCIWRI